MLETQLSQPLNDHMALQGQCNVLTASVAQPDRPRTLGHPESTASGDPWREPHMVPETGGGSVSLKTRHDTDELSKVIKQMVPPG